MRNILLISRRTPFIVDVRRLLLDPLSDVLALLKPESYITSGFDAGGDWAVRFDDMTGRIKCYAVTSGGCWLSVDGAGEPVRLKAGDSFVLPGGRPFMLGSDLSVEPMVASELFAAARRGGAVVHNGGGDVSLAGSRFALHGRHSEMLLRSLPPIIHIGAEREQAMLRWSIERLMAEMRDERPGSSLLARHLAHMMLLEALRLHLSGPTNDSIGWFQALSDPRIGSAIGAMHADPAHHWTLTELASSAGMSRSVFAGRFREKVGETPFGYLTRWRMMLAGDRLTAGREPLGDIAEALGYESENAFNTAFKRVMGCSPRRYARQDGRASKLSFDGPTGNGRREA